MMAVPGPRLRRAAAAAYAAALLTATHWPALEVSGPIQRPDLVVHAAAFGVMAALVAGARLFGAAASARNAAISALAVAAFAAIDELTQGFPALRRTPAWSDWGADAAGAALGAAGVWAVARVRAGAGRGRAL